MAGNFTSGQGDVYVEIDYNNIVMVDPNKKIDDKGNVSERLVDSENLVMYVNLEANVLPRTKLSIGGLPGNDVELVQVAKIDFLKANKDGFMTNQYIDEITGQNSLNGQSINQPKEEIKIKNGKAYYNNTVVDTSNILDTGLLGITSINVTTNSSFVPVVTMTLEDVQGRALFQLGDKSPYAAFFNLPYCIFYLTMKGYYGKAIKYQLNLETFNAKYNNFSGNYTVDLKFKGYKFNILNEISVAHLIATPHMYSKTFNVTRSESNTTITGTQSTDDNINNDSTNSKEETSYRIVSKKGYQKILEVYAEYKAKNLIPQNFPELTLVQLMNKLEMFEKNIINSLIKIDVDSLTNIRSYKQTLTDYFNKIYGNSVSWFNQFVDSRPYITKNNEKIYKFKSNLDLTAIEEVRAQLKKFIIEYNKILDENTTLGKNSKTPIPNPIKYDMFEKIYTIDQIDWVETVKQRTDSITSDDLQINSFKINFIYGDNNIIKSVSGGTQSLFLVFEGSGKFVDTIRNMETLANEKLLDYEDLLTNQLLEKIEDTETGIGFTPTVRNIVAVLMASSEAFIRLLDEVHSNAWDLKYDEIRRKPFSQVSTSAPNSDTIISNINFGQNQESSAAKIPVYPWPQFFVETPEDKQGRFQIKYLGDPKYVKLTNGNLFSKWPEVEFVEEYSRGLIDKFNLPSAITPLNNDSSTPILTINAIEFPNSYLSYLNKEDLKFLYEIWERQYLTGYYSGYARLNNQQKDTLFTENSDIESNNIVSSLVATSPFLASKLKQLNITSSNYEVTLRNSSNNGTGRLYQDYIRDFFVTPYIKNITENSFSIEKTTNLGKLPTSNNNTNKLLSIIKGTNNEQLIVDTYPFTDSSWTSANMSDSSSSFGIEVFNTNKVLKIYQPINTISNFEDVNDYVTNRPVVTFNYRNTPNPFTFQNDYLNAGASSLPIFYQNRTVKDLIPSEGLVEFETPSKLVPFQKTTSILNTPYFVNAIMDGVSRSKNNDQYPYISAAYLFINSLPLATLKERYKSFDTSISDTINFDGINLDYISSTLKKYGAIHKVPYAWVLKIGSIWHRYKRFKQNGVDILEDIWDNTNFIENYSPILKTSGQLYDLTIPNYNTTNQSERFNIRLQVETDNNIDINVGFYPKVINDFNYFFNGYDLYSKYTSPEIQSTLNNGLKLYSFPDSNINGIQNGKNVTVQTWTTLIRDNITPSFETNTSEEITGITETLYFVVPSFGSPINETGISCFVNGNTVTNLTNNYAMYNGSTRLLWSSPNYGYFDSDQITKPTPEQYAKTIRTDSKIQSNFDFKYNNEYSTIEEIFSVFEKSILDKMETEFLNFSKKQTNNEPNDFVSPIDVSPVSLESKYRNFNSLMTSLMAVSPNTNKLSNDEYFKGIITEQFNVFTTGIKGFMEYDVILRYGNPSSYRRRIFNSYLSNDTTQLVVDPINFNPYVNGTLPGQVTVSQSKILNPEAWRTLELEVGFSTIQNLEYVDSGSYITDFFIDNNIEFTKDNIELLAPLIKMYATQKLKNPSLNSQTFKTSLIDYLDKCEDIQNNSIDLIMNKTRVNLPNQIIVEKVRPSAISGEQAKVELYETFKALNDKWIAGGDYQSKTLFEDILFLDRASRNIGDTLLIDIFDLKEMINKNSLNEIMSVYTLIAGLLIKNNFTVMNLPAYINFYNVQDVDGVQNVPNAESSLEFGNNMWGTFLDVDYRNSSPKMVCYFVGRPSQNLQIDDSNFLFRNDAFEMRNLSQNPLIEDIRNKKDWALSNKCVGFTVDMGIRNQNVFYGFSVSQDGGFATSEAIGTQLNMVNQATGREVATQNVGLYNLYKQRSYKCSVVSFGNALIQPTMYFNLRHVPMFNGPYMILDVSHNISPGTFETTFTGIRQGIYDLPSIDSLLQSLNKNLLTRVESIVKSKIQEETQILETNNQKAAEVNNITDNTKAAIGTCWGELSQSYPSYENIEATPVEINQENFANAILNKTKDLQLTEEQKQILNLSIYTICYVKTFVKKGDKDGKFISWNNNFANVELNVFYGESTNNFEPTYCCININAKSKSIANFENLDKFLNFMVDRIKNNIERIKQEGLIKYYVCNWPTNDNNPSAEYFENNKNQFQTVLDIITKAAISASSVGIK
jgi:hypothetical protein